MRLMIRELIDGGIAPESIFYVSADDYTLRGESIIDIVSAYRALRRIPVDRPIYLFIDEVTYKENCRQQLKNLIDRENVTVTASSSLGSLLQDERAFLTGRSTLLEIQPLSFSEYLEFKDIHIARRDRRLLDSYFGDYIRDGGMPENVLRPRRGYLTELVDDIIQKDITAARGLRDNQLVRDYFTLLMERGGKRVSINKIGNILKISPDTSRRYMGYFEEAYLVHRVGRWGKPNERILAPRKVYSCDLGIKYLFVGRRDLGSYFENAVYLALHRRRPIYYVLEGDIELDFFIPEFAGADFSDAEFPDAEFPDAAFPDAKFPGGKKGMLIEAKYNSAPEGRQLRLFEDYPAGEKRLVDSVSALMELEGKGGARPGAGA